jgi:hypothetical protein
MKIVEAATEPVSRPIAGVERRPEVEICGNPVSVPRTGLEEQIGALLLKLQSSRRCVSLLAEFDHALRMHVDMRAGTR